MILYFIIKMAVRNGTLLLSDMEFRADGSHRTATRPIASRRKLLSVGKRVPRTYYRAAGSR